MKKLFLLTLLLISNIVNAQLTQNQVIEQHTVDLYNVKQQLYSISRLLDNNGLSIGTITPKLLPSNIRSLFGAGAGIQYDPTDGTIYLHGAYVNNMVFNYLKSLNGYGIGKILVVGDNDTFAWGTPTSGTVVASNPQPTTTVVASNTAIPADSTLSRIDVTLMTSVTITNRTDFETFIASDQTNKKAVLYGNFVPSNGSFQITGGWTNVLVTSPGAATLTSGNTNVVTYQGNKVKKQVCFDNIAFVSVSGGSGYPMFLSNELVGFDGLEFRYCKFYGKQTGNYNAFGVIQYSTASNYGNTSKNLYVHHSYFTAPRMGMEILSQGYNVPRLTNVIVSFNKFENTVANSGEDHRMAVSFSGLINGIFLTNNNSINAKDIAYEFVNVKHVLALNNTAIATLEPCVGYSVSDDGQNTTEDINIKGGTFTMSSRPFQFYDSKDIHVDGGTYVCKRGADMNCRNSSFNNINILVNNTFAVDPLWQVSGPGNNISMTNLVLSGWGSVAAGANPNFETVVLRNGTSNIVVSGCTLKQAKKSDGTYFTDGTVVNQGASSNTQSNNTVQLEI